VPSRVEVIVFEKEKPHPFQDPAGGQVHIPLLRLMTFVYCGSDRTLREAAIDTCAPLSVFPETVWTAFRNDIRWFANLPGPVLPSWLSHVRGFGGTGFACRIGSVPVVTVGVGNTRLPAVDLLAYFLLDGGQTNRILMGLHGGILEGRRLVVEPDLRQAYIEER